MSAFDPVDRVSGVAAPLIRDNVDTDAIIPSREMKSTGKTGFADGLFAGWRYTEPGGREPRQDFVLNRPEYRGATILLAGANFGSGSSREHAVWALREYGIRVVVAAGFAPIFYGNCIRNGLVPATLPKDDIVEIAAAVAADPQRTPLTISLSSCRVLLPDGRSWTFPIEDEARTMLREGLDAIDITLKMKDRIEAFRQRDRKARPWIYIGGARA
ncbi:MAG: 3-isopropylmalate dehydratase small subunit [Allosphingosinicella sp.]|uniref:3-isopropylmalate dehydratase small subunit n=1 Tax=Allosphingosinicella sp. TaxID=2823234 RepID=UPI00395B7512